LLKNRAFRLVWLNGVGYPVAALALPVRKAGNADSGNGELLSGCSDSIEIALMGTLAGPAGGDRFTFGNDVLDCQLNVGECSAVESRTLLFAFGTSPKFGRRRIMVRVVLCKELVCHRQIALVPNLFE
jgi:hypothetical protein